MFAKIVAKLAPLFALLGYLVTSALTLGRAAVGPVDPIAFGTVARKSILAGLGAGTYVGGLVLFLQAFASSAGTVFLSPSTAAVVVMLCTSVATLVSGHKLQVAAAIATPAQAPKQPKGVTRAEILATINSIYRQDLSQFVDPNGQVLGGLVRRLRLEGLAEADPETPRPGLSLPAGPTSPRPACPTCPNA